MKAIQFQAYGSYEENRLVEVDCPKPKDGEVLVEMRAVGINSLDNTFRSDHIYLSTPENLPRIGGHSGVGVVLETRSADFKAGDRVFVKGPGWGLVTDGTWREYVAAAAAGLVRVPTDLDDDHAAGYLAGAGPRHKEGV
jgi:NADPH:quinone reductase-like Zn-dependent oxidoreductase